MKDNRAGILLTSWKKCESYLVAKVEQKGTKDEDSNILKPFLIDIGFVESKTKGLVDNITKVTSKGRKFYEEKYIHNNSDGAQLILTEALKETKPALLICSVLWGNPNINKENVQRLLQLNGIISGEIKAADLSGYLMLLNTCNMLKYSKKTNKITIIHNPKSGEPKKERSTFISPDTPYSNIKNLWDCLRKCKEYVYWFDQHFSPKGLEPLSDELDGNVVKKVKVLLGIKSNINFLKLKRDFKRFSAEMKSRGIASECRVICDKKVLGDIHARYIIGKDVCFNVPPVNSIYKGQVDEFNLTKNLPPFDTWWSQGFDLIGAWAKIEPSLKKP